MWGYSLAISSALLLALCFNHVIPCYLGFVSLVPFAWALRVSSRHRARSIGFLWGMVFFLFLLWWLVPTISIYGTLPLPLSAIVVLALCSYLALYPSLWAHLLKLIELSEKGPVLQILAGSGAWVLLDFIRGSFQLGFPWGMPAYCLVRYPMLIQTADIWGIYGMDFVLLSVNLSLAFVSSDLVCTKSIDKRIEKRAPAGMVIAVILCFCICYGYWKVNLDHAKTGETLHVAAIQGSIAQNLKWNPALTMFTIDRYENLSLSAVSSMDADRVRMSLLVWPETSMPFYFQEDSVMRRRILDFARLNRLYILFGSPSYRKRPRHSIEYLNSAFMVGPDGTVIGKYDKRHLVPFGEYIPFGPLFSWLRSYLPTAGDFVPGGSSLPIGDDRLRVGVMICFESIFPDMARKEVLFGANLLAVITNDAWFGRTPAPWQHADMAIYRAIETRKWLIRAANTGVSRIISPKGEIVAETRLFEPAFITANIDLSSQEEQTFYVRYGHFWLLAFSLFIVIIVLMPSKKFERRNNRHEQERQ